jgi:hypothetical protein
VKSLCRGIGPSLLVVGVVEFLHVSDTSDVGSKLAMLVFLASLLPVLIAVKVAKDQRGNCNWPLVRANRSVWVSVFLIGLSQLVFLTPAKPLSPLALLSFGFEVVGVYLLARGIYRKKDLAKTPIPSAAP